MSGGFDDWAYEERGTFAFTVELWNVAEAAGVSTPDPAMFHFMGQMSEDDLLTILKWSDAHPHWGGFSPWQVIEHPQLGPVEVGAGTAWASGRIRRRNALRRNARRTFPSFESSPNPRRS